MRAAIPGQRSWGGSMLLGRRPTASCSSRSFIAPASPVAGAGPVAFDVEEHEHLPRSVRQLCDRSLEIDVQVEGRSMLRPYYTVWILRRHHAPLPPAGRPAFVQDDVDRQAVQPRAERAVAPE